MSETTARDEDARIYPCDRCGVLRSKAEGGTVFTVCDDCWSEIYGHKRSEPAAGEPTAEERAREVIERAKYHPLPGITLPLPESLKEAVPIAEAYLALLEKHEAVRRERDEARKECRQHEVSIVNGMTALAERTSERDAAIADAASLFARLAAWEAAVGDEGLVQETRLCCLRADTGTSFCVWGNGCGNCAEREEAIESYRAAIRARVDAAGKEPPAESGKGPEQ